MAALTSRLRGPGGRRVARELSDEESALGNALARLNAVLTSWTIVLFTLPFWFVIFTLWVLSLLGLGLESVPFLSYLIPGEELFQSATLLGVVLNVMLIIVALIFYIIRGVDCMGGRKDLIFAICTALSMAPLLFFIPFLYIWVFFVATSKPGNTQVE